MDLSSLRYSEYYGIHLTSLGTNDDDDHPDTGTKTNELSRGSSDPFTTGTNHLDYIEFDYSSTSTETSNSESLGSSEINYIELGTRNGPNNFSIDAGKHKYIVSNEIDYIELDSNPGSCNFNHHFGTLTFGDVRRHHLSRDRESTDCQKASRGDKTK
jgi:hypothetical protein